MNIGITGHRPNKLGGDYALTSPLVLRIKRDIEAFIKPYVDEAVDGVEMNLKFVTGMALGIDTLFAQIAIEQGVPFIAAIPCINQETKWTRTSQELYRNLISHPLCQRVHVSKEPYTRHCMDDRNRWMVHHTDIMIAVWNGTEGGTGNCVQYARFRNKFIKYIDV